jgi:hypothetical protein
MRLDLTSTDFHLPDFDSLTFVSVKVCLITWTPRVYFLLMVSMPVFLLRLIICSSALLHSANKTKLYSRNIVFS